MWDCDFNFLVSGFTVSCNCSFYFLGIYLICAEMAWGSILLDI